MLVTSWQQGGQHGVPCILLVMREKVWAWEGYDGRKRAIVKTKIPN